MPVRGESSRYARTNIDGSIDIFCDYCKGFIGTSIVRMKHAVCKLCELAEAGTQLTPDQLAMYRASKGGRRGDVSFLHIPEPEELKKQDAFSVRGFGMNILRAAGFPKVKDKGLESVKASQKKKRKPLFETADDEQSASLGSMLEVDAALQKERKLEP